MTVVGLTGNFGMGKSTVARMFRQLGAMTIDTDEIVRALLDDAGTVYEIRKAFGDVVVKDGVVDRKALAELVFKEPPLRILIEDIIHPRVFNEVDRIISSIPERERPTVVVVEAPVLFERGYQNRFDAIVTVFTSEETAIGRLMDKGVGEDEAMRRLRSQFPAEMKTGKSDFVVDNGGDEEETRRQVDLIYQELAARGRSRGNN